jgi:hypothetical protein
MSDILIRASLRGDAHWSYDDPSGVPETPPSVPVPEPLRGRPEWALALVARGLPSLSTPKAV